MNISTDSFNASPQDITKFRNRWKEFSRKSGWRFGDDWEVPEVGKMIEALFCGTDVSEAARNLGASRAFYGAGIRESVLDLGAFFETAARLVDTDVMLFFLEGWTFENEQSEALSCTDLNTGLSTRAHFEKRIYDLSRTARSERENFTIATLSLERTGSLYPLKWNQLTQIGQILLSEFDGIDATSAFEHPKVNIIMPRTRPAYTALIRCVRIIEEAELWEEDEQWLGGLIAVSFQAIPVEPYDFARITNNFRAQG